MTTTAPARTARRRARWAPRSTRRHANAFAAPTPTPASPLRSYRGRSKMDELALVFAPGVSMVMPQLVLHSGAAAARHTLEFFTARIPNAHTREAYGRAVFRFCAWCDLQGV